MPQFGENDPSTEFLPKRRSELTSNVAPLRAQNNMKRGPVVLGTSAHCAESACLLPVDHAALHDKADALEHGDVLKRIAWNSDDVGPIARLQRANLILPAE